MTSSRFLILLIFATSPCFAQDLENALSHRAKAEALFAKHCERSGEFVYRRVDDVEGILLLKVRPSTVNYGDTKAEQYELSDPYGDDFGADAYIKSFLREAFEFHSKRGTAEQRLAQQGFLFVEAFDGPEKSRVRYRGYIEEPWQRDKTYLKGYLRFSTKKDKAGEHPPRYGVTYDDISTTEDRDHWIAGSSLKVIDLQTNELIGERIGYMFDRGMGSKAAGRSPWLQAPKWSCPAFAGPNPSLNRLWQTNRFVEKILKPLVSSTR